jgi:tripartite-type tricarboxylate transporter receptor subunit TctC
MERLNLTRRQCLAGFAAATLAPVSARAQRLYPAGEAIKIVAGYAPGSTSDIVGRLVADRLGTIWRVPVIVENVTGANGDLANERVAKGPRDGRQILVMTVNLATNQFLRSRLNYDPEHDFIPISCIARLPSCQRCEFDDAWISERSHHLAIGLIADAVSPVCD